MTNRRQFLKQIAVGAAGATFLTSCSQSDSAAPAKTRPNIIIIYVDDLARGDVGADCLADCQLPVDAGGHDRPRVVFAVRVDGNLGTPGI
ncbi:twin-arginine translocation signal domain-containing protein [Acidobacteriota bacterium]